MALGGTLQEEAHSGQEEEQEQGQSHLESIHSPVPGRFVSLSMTIIKECLLTHYDDQHPKPWDFT